MLANAVKTIFNTALVTLIGAVLLFNFTDGLRAFTSEGARRLAIEENPIVLPNISLIDTQEELFQISDYKNKTIFVDFIFTNCTSICPMATQNFKQLHKQLQTTSLKERVMLLTISFDPERDSPHVLNLYSNAVGADPNSWKFATVQNKQALQKLLDTFGIVVIPAPNGQFEHNSAIHLVNEKHQLAKIYDTKAIDQIIDDLESEHGNA